MAHDYASGGPIVGDGPEAPFEITFAGTCVCGRPAYRMAGGLLEHYIPRGAVITGAAIRDWLHAPRLTEGT